MGSFQTKGSFQAQDSGDKSHQHQTEWYVWTKLRGQDQKVKIVFDPRWTVYHFKREIVRKVVAPALRLRRHSQSTSKAEKRSSENKEDDDETIDHSKLDNEEDPHFDEIEAELEKDARAGLPRPEVLQLENELLGDKLTNNRVTLEVALHDLGVRGISPENSNALIIVWHPELSDREDSLKEADTGNPYEEIELGAYPGGSLEKVLARAESLVQEWEKENNELFPKPKLSDDESDTTRLHPPKKEQLESEEHRKRLQEQEMERRLRQADLEREDRLKQEQEKLQKRQGTWAYRFEHYCSFPASNLVYFFWMMAQLCLWIGYAYAIWAGWKYRDEACDRDLPLWLFISGIANLVMLSFYLIVRWIAECRKTTPQEEIGTAVGCLLFFFSLLFFFCLAWQVVGTVYVIGTNTATCDTDLFETAKWFVAARWVVLIIQSCLDIIPTF